ncbi:hypothetical protein BH23CHL5_BH23CHL5_21450 [soil metagenome]
MKRQTGVNSSCDGAPLAAARRIGLTAAVAILIALAGALSTGTPPASAYSDGWVNTDVLNLRDGPGTWAGVVLRMWNGEYVGVLSGPTDDGWYKVEYRGTVGWSYGAYLLMNGSAGWGGSGGGGSGERWADVNRSTRMVTLYEGNTVVASYWSSLGWDQSNDGFYATANGTYYVYNKHRDLAWTDWGQAYIKYWIGFDPYRYNGFHSYSLDASGNVLPNGDGATGGCVALPLWAAEIVFDFLSIGSRVEVHW